MSVLRAVSLDALDADNSLRTGIKVQFNRKERARGICLHRRHLPLSSIKPPLVDSDNRVHRVKYEEVTEPSGQTRRVLTGSKDRCEALLLRVILPRQHSFESKNHFQVLLQNHRGNSVGLLLIAEAGLLIRVNPKRAREPVFVYVTKDLDVIFGSKEVVASHGAFR